MEHCFVTFSLTSYRKIFWDSTVGLLVTVIACLAFFTWRWNCTPVCGLVDKTPLHTERPSLERVESVEETRSSVRNHCPDQKCNTCRSWQSI